MIRRYPWHALFALFILVCLANIFQKLRWSGSSDRITWEASEKGLVCTSAPRECPVHVGDVLVAINKYLVHDRIDQRRVIEGRSYCLYEVERQGRLKNVGVDIARIYTPFSYYIMVFVGIVIILLTLGVLNITVRKSPDFRPPPVFYWLALTFSGFMIFSPTGAYPLSDFLYLALDRASFLFFPAVLLQYTLQQPFVPPPLRHVNRRFKLVLIYLAPTLVGLLHLYFIASGLANPSGTNLLATLGHFNLLSQRLFAVYLPLAGAALVYSQLTLILKRRERRYLLTLAGSVTGLAALLVLDLLPSLRAGRLALVGSLGQMLTLFLPLSLVYLLSHRRYQDIETIIRKTLSISSVFIFIFGIYLFLGLSIEQNKLLGIFWSLAAILLAGLLFKPIETTIQKYFEQIFYRETYRFKRKLRELERSISAQRDLMSLARNALPLIQEGFQLEQAGLIIHERGQTYRALPENRRLALSAAFRAALRDRDYLLLLSDQEFHAKFPRDHEALQPWGYCQFLPLTSGDRLIGLLAMGRKSDRGVLTVEDWDLLASITHSLALAVENAHLYTQLEEQLRELHLLKEFNENVIENVDLGIMVVSPAGKIRSWNRFMAQRFGIPPEKAIHRSVAAVLGEPVGQRLAGSGEATATFRNVAAHPQEPDAVFDIYVSPLRARHAAENDHIAVFEDVSEKTHIQNQLITSEKMASLGLLSAGIAHEINTPLTGISSYCQFLLDNEERGESRAMIARVQDQVQRANKIVRSLLDFSRQKGEQPAEVDMSAVIDDAIALVEHRLKRKGVVVHRELQAGIAFHGYPSRLQQLFINLLLNACDAVADGGAGRISIQSRADGNVLTVRFKDNGAGIPDELREKIFDPFFTTKAAGQGTGLGLSIVYNIVKEHFGAIEVNSRVGKGTTFTITFPLDSPLRRMKL